MMKAIVWTKYGPPDGLQLREVPDPVPGDNEILVKVHATTVTAGDCEMRRLQLPLMLSLPMRLYTGFMQPKRITILGQELAGEVIQVGRNARNFKVGDAVFGVTGFKFGANAETICLPDQPGDAQGVLAPKPAGVSFEEAAAVPTAAFEALHFMRAAGIQPGKKVLVVGGGGSIGTYSIQLAKFLGAEVTAVDSTEKQELMRTLGVDRVIDYTQEDYFKEGAFYDLIIDVVGRRGVARRLGLLKADGVYFLAFAGFRHVLLSLWTSLTSHKKLKFQSAVQSREDLVYLGELVAAGKLKPVIDKRYTLAQVPNAHRYVEAGYKKGNIVINVSPV
jgi:2-desacetyl-2-hydroxyethyl bacteriochlorophyllide A dehydrogenase